MVHTQRLKASCSDFTSVSVVAGGAPAVRGIAGNCCLEQCIINS